jgi:hypothetical protein
MFLTRFLETDVPHLKVFERRKMQSRIGSRAFRKTFWIVLR